ncbi:cation:proton antiporter [Methanospirillum sp.]|uniref:cation:proton antiporter domain-containing protein n=3 Tax=Methanospirillum sp. TaxID=45200 RepID=UPI002BA6333A|nr:cation:proton antiporter [Methanospirillum sp.]HOL41518.1 cation:proton antiporter [Methanospirillum sp.]HPP76660.1 cation:proton antiporter [Methanospirillum sp.]
MIGQFMEGQFATLFTGIVVVFIIAVLLLIILYRVKIPSVVAFLIAGFLVGPSGLGLITNEESISFFAELGVIFLLFTIGLEFSVSRILKSRRYVLIGGLVQVLSTILIWTSLMQITGMDLAHAFFWGMLISLSSTAIVMKVLADRMEVDSPHGRATLGILIFQDLIVIPMVMITPVLAGTTDTDISLVRLLIGSFVIIAVVYISARYVVPALLLHAARLKNREMFLFIVMGTCLIVAYLTSEFGLSMALGAFLAGIIISESEYSTHAMSSILPFRDLFTSFFFISIGMIFNLQFFVHNPVIIAELVLLVIGIKYATGTLASLLAGLAPRACVMTGISLAQVGEFSFVLATAGNSLGFFAQDSFQLFLDVSIVTMGVAPLLMGISGKIAPPLSSPLCRIIPDRTAGDDPVGQDLEDHIIIVGYGLNGKNVARSADIAGVPYRIIEMNPDTVREEKAKGKPIMFGDAAQGEVLKKAGIAKARVLVIVVNDPFGTQQIVQTARMLNPAVHIIVRTRYMGEVATLMELGADEVIPEEFETAVEIFTRILYTYLIPTSEIERLVSEIRAGGYQMLRSINTPSYSFDDLRVLVPDVEIRTIRIADDSQYAGKMLKETMIRSTYQVSIVAIRRGQQMIVSPGGDEILCAKDLVMVLGSPDNIIRAFSA